MSAEPLTITATVPAATVLALGDHLAREANGKWRTVVNMLAMLAGGMLFGAGLGLGLGVALWKALLISEFAVLGVIASMILMHRLNRRRAAALLSTSPMRSDPLAITLGAGGVTLGARDIPWTRIGAAGRWRNCTLLPLSPLDAVVIPDRDLPPGLTPEILARQIAGWRQT